MTISNGNVASYWRHQGTQSAPIGSHVLLDKLNLVGSRFSVPTLNPYRVSFAYFETNPTRVNSNFVGWVACWVKVY